MSKKTTFLSNTQLLNAYNSLRREFTKKCQQLKKLEQSLNKDNSSSTQNNSPISSFVDSAFISQTQQPIEVQENQFGDSNLSSLESLQKIQPINDDNLNKTINDDNLNNLDAQNCISQKNDTICSQKDCNIGIQDNYLLDFQSNKKLNSQSNQTFDSQSNQKPDFQSYQSLDSQANQSLDFESNQKPDFQSNQSLDSQANQSIDFESNQTSDSQSNQSIECQTEDIKLDSHQSQKEIDNLTTESFNNGNDTKQIKELLNSALSAYIDEVVGKNAPKTISGASGHYVLAPKKKPSSIAELDAIVIDFFNKSK